jgi:hypothetical protein
LINLLDLEIKYKKRWFQYLVAPDIDPVVLIMLLRWLVRQLQSIAHHVKDGWLEMCCQIRI